MRFVESLLDKEGRGLNKALSLSILFLAYLRA